MARAMLARLWAFIRDQWTDSGYDEDYDEEEDEEQNAIFAHLRATNASIREIQQKLQTLEKIGGILNRADAHADADADDDLSFLDEPDVEPDKPPVGATVKFPRDATKHPWLTVLAKEVRREGAVATEIAFATSRAAASARKRKYSDMSLIYQGVHPNPQLAVCCITEEWQERGLSFSKRARQPVYLVDSNIQKVKRAVYENI
uniref:38.7K n=1 Tax=Lymantria dispar multicapsid nuclear polyhedrosis virus TaxID=10449 RepID=V9TL34_NPVLD|nr:38.7K [Lymantria dispar multiple nucleopolyhedrovirus]